MLKMNSFLDNNHTIEVFHNFQKHCILYDYIMSWFLIP